MKMIGISQRVTVVEKYNERRDNLDQKWSEFLFDCGYLPLMLPNNQVVVEGLFKENSINGIILTGGNDLSSYGGDAPERDETEIFCLQYAMKKNLPLLGVCRGMQIIQDYFGVRLTKIEGHVTKKQLVTLNEHKVEVNSYHNFGTKDSVDTLEVWGVAEDGIIEAIKHREKPILGIMWHPERNYPFYEEDTKLIKNFFN